ncbi:hypothetical protein LSTR_LSTR016758 [Laodelphax striatellus]|uniref:Uncharacterized protein n=1 Tax=Laodelphax striatellus TaxID=195883 RepID=A0A482X3L9_LAOST|nr:hypothetical protein LSTR_LSTR016758 [Laodelphax striatellus]
MDQLKMMPIAPEDSSQSSSAPSLWMVSYPTCFSDHLWSLSCHPNPSLSQLLFHPPATPSPAFRATWMYLSVCNMQTTVVWSVHSPESIIRN